MKVKERINGLAKGATIIFLSLLICSLLSLLLIPPSGLIDVYTSDIILKILFTSIILNSLLELVNGIMKKNKVLRYLSFIVLPLIISSIGGIIFYFLWIYKKLPIEEEIYLMIVVIGAINGLLIALLHFVFNLFARRLKANLT